jgi:hypothetical protein
VRISERTATHIAVLTRVFDVDPALGHQLRVAAHRRVFTVEQAARVIDMLRSLPPCTR